MHCKLCGKEIWLSGFFRDRDFCVPSHRRKFNERLRNVIQQSEASEITALRAAGPRPLALPTDCPAAASPFPRLESMPFVQSVSVSLWESRAIAPIAALEWEFENEAETTMAEIAIEPAEAAIEAPRLCVDEMPATPPAAPYESRMQRVLDLLSKMRGKSEKGKRAGLHAAA